MNPTLTILIILLPFAAFVINGLLSDKLPHKAAGWLAVIAIGISTFLSWQSAANYFSQFGPYIKQLAFNITWLRFTDALQIDMGILLDPISVMMLVVITTISLMVFLYSLGYMHGEKGFVRYFAFLSLFSFSMLGLVVATNLFQLYMFWELVGVSSYLLIGYYYDKPEAVAAAKKAFIVTRFADFGFLVGILIISYYTGTFDFITITNPANPAIASITGISFMGISVLTWALVLIFMGGAGKSAMFPLHIWLPDAMEGPTPVSALIHAATMVVAGVFLVARMFPVFVFHAPVALDVVAFIGAFTLLFAAIIACTQTDIKRILAFSTMSQIGYMMLAIGVSGYGQEGLGFTASMFHLFTHAFFKALLFLGAGSIIHAVHANDIREMGGLRKYQPVTHILFLIACLAIAGIPPFAGFFSKDEILTATLASNPVYFIMATLAAALTAFYMFRLYFLVFWNNDRTYEHTPHESPAGMLVPMGILAIGSITAGFIPFGNYVTSDGNPLETPLHLNVAVISVTAAVAGIAAAWLFYKKKSETPDKIASSLGGLYQTIYRKFYIDEIYVFITKRIIFNLVSRPLAWFDRHIIDGFMDFTAAATNWISLHIREFQSGQLQKYAYIFLSGVILIVLVVLYSHR
ncbi:MAG: NADH-quinone oxidoreductase subunit L [Flammeovirgaceae bacterium]|nr:MAG: NADH-quinone oxidoreductase subunit L [Flammeovirgaceae bacterium]